ncbi:hypothetical protein Taro_054576 [Colocasia esculenta]|uniref:Uncharacterized protein n=1 Tax=Colocasia esculenta TaxID=4460 RepID=A0A843XP34_COLES|nr:hypothetical protein [Colocasia esculenta]
MASLPFLNAHDISLSLSLSLSSPTVKEEVEAEDNEGWNDPPPAFFSCSTTGQAEDSFSASSSSVGELGSAHLRPIEFSSCVLLLWLQKGSGMRRWSFVPGGSKVGDGFQEAKLSVRMSDYHGFISF